VRSTPKAAIFRYLVQAHRALATLAKDNVFQILRLELRILVVRKRETTADCIEHSHVFNSLDRRPDAS
jgi:hypothetical protein